jgi:signal transduction histidine kinase
VLRNLVDNAMKYSPDGSTVIVEASQVPPGAAGAIDRASGNTGAEANPAEGASSVELGEVMVTVTDSGDGIPLEEQGRLFETYRRGPNARSRGVAGSGLGLAISRRLVEAQGGRIWVESPVHPTNSSDRRAPHAARARAGELGAGTRVCFTLPVSAAQPEPPDTERLFTDADLADDEPSGVTGVGGVAEPASDAVVATH